MPVYEQSCNGCGAEFEIITGSYSAPRPCPQCLSLDTDQLVSTPNFRVSQRKHEIKRGPSHNPYENLMLQHVRGEDGKPITVNSEKELHAAEKKYNFIHNASWGMEAEPPQHEKWAGNVAHTYKRKWAKDPNAYVSPDATKGVSTGVAANAGETLASRPNPI